MREGTIGGASRSPRQKKWCARISLLGLMGLLACDGSTDSPGGAEGSVRSGNQAAVTGTGVSECDAYLTAYEACINQVVTGSANQAAALEGLNKNRADWAVLADNSAKKEALARLCSRAQLDLAENSCSWTPAGAGGSSGTGGASSVGGASSGGSSSVGGTSSGGAGTGGSAGSACTSANAEQIAAAVGTSLTRAANACIKISPPPWGAAKIKLQSQDGTTVTYPLSFTWFQNSGSGCGTAGMPSSASFSGSWNEQVTDLPPNHSPFGATCPVVFSFSGSAVQSFKFTYYYQ